jgi:serine/threonine-protein kinase RsbW
MNADPSTPQPSANVIRLDIPADHKYLNVLGACVDALLAHVEMRIGTLDERAALSYTVQLAVHETCTNVIDHAYESRQGGRIHIAFMLEAVKPATQIVIEVHDTGAPFDPSTIPAPNLDEPHEHGYGVFLMHSLMDDITYHSTAEGNYCRLRKRLS